MQKTVITEERILLSHGSGGRLSHDLVKEIFIKRFSNEILELQTDAALIPQISENIAFTTDSYVVDPIFFPGGDIGKLAICGTVNDLTVTGAIPEYLSVGFILEEGFEIEKLEAIVESMAIAAREANIKIVTGDTKVVNKGKCDKIFINTAGIGTRLKKNRFLSIGKNIKPGDKIIVNGTLGDHGIAILSARESLNFETPVLSDCAPLNKMIKNLQDSGIRFNFMRDATRGGVATVLNEIVNGRNFGIDISEQNIPLKEEVKGTCEVFGFDPLYLANEGKILIIVPENQAKRAIDLLRQERYGKKAGIIGEVTSEHPGKVVMQTEVGGSRIIDMLTGEMLPRIC